MREYLQRILYHFSGGPVRYVMKPIRQLNGQRITAHASHLGFEIFQFPNAFYLVRVGSKLQNQVGNQWRKPLLV